MTYGIRDKQLGKGRGARNSYGKFGSKVPLGEKRMSGKTKSGTKGMAYGPRKGKK
jgi:hypothetical protein